jgi:polyhydroxyalkanoate synthesis regulator phasin
MKKILVSLAAAGVLVAGIATAAVISSSEAAAQEAPETDELVTDESTETAPRGPGAAVQQVLDELVGTGDITQTQADTIIAALQEQWEEIRANRPEGRRGHGPHRGFKRGFHLGGLLEDGVIDAAELAELPEGHILTDEEGPFAEVAADGEITEEEFRSVVEELRESGEGPFGPRFEADDTDVEGANT